MADVEAVVVRVFPVLDVDAGLAVLRDQELLEAAIKLEAVLVAGQKHHAHFFERGLRIEPGGHADGAPVQLAFERLIEREPLVLRPGCDLEPEAGERRGHFLRVRSEFDAAQCRSTILGLDRRGPEQQHRRKRRDSYLRH